MAWTPDTHRVDEPGKMDMIRTHSNVERTHNGHIEHKMLFTRREREIVEIVNQHGGYEVRELARRFAVTEATIRRDLRKLEAHRLLQRQHGAAVALADGASGNMLPTLGAEDDANGEDALILAPVHNSMSHTLRERSVRNGIPFLAESCPQEGAIYLGPNNREVGEALGRWTGEHFLRTAPADALAHILDISEFALPNTRERSEGFAEGIRAILGDRAIIRSVDGGGLYVEAYQIAMDALRLNPATNVIFGINDDSILAGMQAHLDLGRTPHDLIAVNVGAEGETILAALDEKSSLVASAALFPEIVGRLAVDAVVQLWSNGSIDVPIITPYAILTHENLRDYYHRRGDRWELDGRHMFPVPGWAQQLPAGYEGKEIAFVILHQTHEWYQHVARAMQQRADHYGIRVAVKNLRDDLEVEVRELRRLIGKLAASQVENGQTIILDTGSTTMHMAQFLRQHRDLTVITNSQDVFERLHSVPGITLMLTGGEYDSRSRSFVGRGAQLMLRDMRVDKAFIVAGGLSLDFGISSVTAQEADVRRAMIESAREIVVLADHTVLQNESNHRVGALDVVDTLITDAGIRTSHSLELSQRGIKVVVAGRVASQSQP
jgi:DeoR/GlpR family transcriptional regulator of sugar metabolism